MQLILSAAIGLLLAVLVIIVTSWAEVNDSFPKKPTILEEERAAKQENEEALRFFKKPYIRDPFEPYVAPKKDLK